MKLQQKIIFSIMGGMLIGFVSFLGINHKMMQETATVEIYNKLNAMTSFLTKDIEEWLSDKHRIAYALSESAKKLEDRSSENVRRYLHLVNRAANIDASMVYYKGKTLIHTEPDWALSPEEEEANMPYQTMLKNGFKPAISEIFKSPINKVDNMITAIVPFNVDSLATLVVELRDIEEKVAGIKLEGGFAALIDTNRKILVDPKPHFLGKTLAENEPKLKHVEDMIFSSKSGLYEYIHNDKHYIMIFDTIEKTGWKVVLTMDKDFAFSNLNAQTKKLVYMSIGFFLLGTLLMNGFNFVFQKWNKELVQKKEEYEFLLAHQSKMSEIGGLVSGINHQLHQPLNSLKLLNSSMLSKVKKDSLSPEILESNLNMSAQSIELMSKTIGLFRNFYKFDGNINQFALRECIDSVLQVLYVDFSRKNIGVDIECKMCESVVITSVDSFIQQVLLVLLQNSKDALLATEEKTHKNIQIAVAYEKDDVILDVHDWGEGINKEVKAKLFENTKGSKKDLGSGIGLFFARKIAREKLQGDLVLLHDANPTTFRFTFKRIL